MKRKTIKPIIISALMAVSFGATAVGTTFALFTDRADTKIEVTAGVVDLEIKYENLKAYSLDETDNSKWVQVENGKFATDGTYTLNEQTGVVKLERMVPGDKVEFDIKLLNKSNVKTKYRFAMSKKGTLAPYLEASFGNEATLQWTALDASNDLVNGKEIETAHVVIEFPNNTETSILPREEGYDNGAQGLSATYVLGYEMVQGNAQVVDAAPAIDPVTVTKPAKADSEHEGIYTFDIMSDDALVGVKGIAANSGDVTLTVAQGQEGNFTIEGATTANYDINVTNRAAGEPVTVKLYVGEGYQEVYIFHDEETTPLPNTVYDAKTGYVEFTTTNFSPFHFAGVKEEVTFVSTAAELQTAIDGDKKYIVLKNDIDATNVITLNKDTTIDGAGHKLTTSNYTSSDARSINVGNPDKAISAKLRNLTVIGPNGAYSRGVNIYNANATLDIDKCNISAGHYAINIPSSPSDSVININNSVVSGYAALNVWGTHQQINAKNSRFVGTNSYSGASSNFAVICFESDTTHQTTGTSKNSVIKLEDCVITAVELGTCHENIINFNSGNPAASNNTLITNNCTFNPANNNHVFSNGGPNNSWLNDSKEMLPNQLSVDVTGLTIETDGYHATGVVKFNVNGASVSFNLSEAETSSWYDTESETTGMDYVFDYDVGLLTYNLDLDLWSGYETGYALYLSVTFKA